VSLLLVLLIVWGVLTTILIVLLIYRSTLSMHEDEQLFLDESSSHMAQAQMEVTKKVNRITPLVRVFGATSGLLILVIAGIWVYQSLTAVQ
jgi:Tfp pilus assembly protein PilN